MRCCRPFVIALLELIVFLSCYIIVLWLANIINNTLVPIGSVGCTSVICNFGVICCQVGGRAHVDILTGCGGIKTRMRISIIIFLCFLNSNRINQRTVHVRLVTSSIVTIWQTIDECVCRTALDSFDSVIKIPFRCIGWQTINIFKFTQRRDLDHLFSWSFLTESWNQHIGSHRQSWSQRQINFTYFHSGALYSTHIKITPLLIFSQT